MGIQEEALKHNVVIEDLDYVNPETGVLFEFRMIMRDGKLYTTPFRNIFTDCGGWIAPITGEYAGEYPQGL